MNKLMKAQKKIEKTVVDGYKAIEDGVISGYQKIENAAVSGYKKIEDKFVDTFMSEDPRADNKVSGSSQNETSSGSK